MEAVAHRVDTDRILGMMAELSEIEKLTDFDSFERAIEYAGRRFEEVGASCQTIRFPADGQTEYFTYTSPIGFRTAAARCEILTPDHARCVLGDRQIEPNTAFAGTGHTGPDGFIGEVVHVRSAADLCEGRLKGKVLYFSEMDPCDWRAEIIACKALSVVSSYTPDRAQNRAYVTWNNRWDGEPDGWLPTKSAAEQNLPAISISPEMGSRLEQVMDQEAVMLKITVTGEYFGGTLPSLDAHVPGQKPREVFFTAHLFEQGLNDNASGVAVSWAVADILNRIKQAQGIPEFRRGTRHFHGQECYSVMALQRFKPEIPRRGLANMTLEMLSEKGFGLISVQGLFATQSFSAFLLDLVAEEAKAVTGLVCDRYPEFSINCTLLADPGLGGIPTTFLAADGSVSWHTSRDRIGHLEIDADKLRLATLIAATWTHFMVNAGTEEALWLLGQFGDNARRVLASGESPDTELYLAQRRQEIMSLLELVDPHDIAFFEQEIRRLFDEFENSSFQKKTIVPDGSESAMNESHRMFPVVLIPGPATAKLFTKDELGIIGSRPKWDSTQLVLKVWANGKRSVYEITRRGLFEGAPRNRLTLDYAVRLFKIYARAGLVRLADSPQC
jgi:hypothetical protein